MARLTLTAKMAWSMWQTNRGFSLVEVLVAVMVTGIAMVMVSRFMQNFYRSQAAVEAAASVDEELNRFVKQLKTRWSQRAAPIDPATQMAGDFTQTNPGFVRSSNRRIQFNISKMDPVSGGVTSQLSFIETRCDRVRPAAIKQFGSPFPLLTATCKCASDDQLAHVVLNDSGLGLQTLTVPNDVNTPGTKIQSLAACFSWDGARSAADRDARRKDAFHDLKVELEATYLGPGNKIFSTKRTVMLPINSPHKTATFLLK